MQKALVDDLEAEVLRALQHVRQGASWSGNTVVTAYLVSPNIIRIDILDTKKGAERNICENFG